MIEERAKATKTASELEAILSKTIEHSCGDLLGAQWIRIVRVDPPRNGANWTVSHGGESGDLSNAIDKAQAELKRRYDLV